MDDIHHVIDKKKQWLIRSIQETDLKKLEWGKMYRPYRKLMRKSFEDHLMGKKVYLVARVNGKITGQIIIDWRILKDLDKSDGKTRVYLYSLRVFPAFRNQGLGTTMISFCENFLQNKGFKFATIACEKKNPRAAKLYQRLGYKIFKEDNSEWKFEDHKGVIRKVNEPEWVLEKALV